MRLCTTRCRPASRDKTGGREEGPTLTHLGPVLADETTAWEHVTVEDWYGHGKREVEMTSDTAVWYHAGKPVVPIRWVVMRDPEEGFEPQALLATDLDLSPQDIVASFVRRWQMEVTFAEARAHLGMETQRQWNGKAIARTTPALLALYSLVTLMAQELLATVSLSVRRAAWYGKTPGDLLRYDRVGSSVFVGACGFFHVACGDGYGKSPPCFGRTSNRGGLLRCIDG